MTEDRTALMEALQMADDGNFLRSLAETVHLVGPDLDRQRRKRPGQARGLQQHSFGPATTV